MLASNWPDWIFVLSLRLLPAWIPCTPDTVSWWRWGRYSLLPAPHQRAVRSPAIRSAGRQAQKTCNSASAFVREEEILGLCCCCVHKWGSLCWSWGSGCCLSKCEALPLGWRDVPWIFTCGLCVRKTRILPMGRRFWFLGEGDKERCHSSPYSHPTPETLRGICLVRGTPKQHFSSLFYFATLNMTLHPHTHSRSHGLQPTWSFRQKESILLRTKRIFSLLLFWKVLLLFNVEDIRAESLFQVGICASQRNFWFISSTLPSVLFGSGTFNDLWSLETSVQNSSRLKNPSHYIKGLLVSTCWVFDSLKNWPLTKFGCTAGHPGLGPW